MALALTEGVLNGTNRQSSSALHTTLLSSGVEMASGCIVFANVICQFSESK